MKKFYFAGHNNFGNRGCEALVRSTALLLKEKFGDVEIRVPSYVPSADRKQWLDAEKYGVKFVSVPQYPLNIKLWGRLERVFPLIKKFWFPRFSVPASYAQHVDDCDAVVMIGGDVITLDYGVGPLMWQVGFVEHFQRKGIPAILWAASTGPFSKDKTVESYMARFLASLKAITIRESITVDYLSKIGVESNVTAVADPAFVMLPEPVSAPDILAALGARSLGLNVSPLIAKFRVAGEDPGVLQQEVADFIDQVVQDTDLHVVLIPHVGSVDGVSETTNSDHAYMSSILKLVKNHAKVTLLPDHMNAAQLKWVLSQCRFFIGARTHATIGAISSQVPTISIAYSVKARGLNRDIFGTEAYVLNTPQVTKSTLWQSLQLLIKDEDQVRAHLAVRVPQIKERSKVSAEVLAGILAKA